MVHPPIHPSEEENEDDISDARLLSRIIQANVTETEHRDDELYPGTVSGIALRVDLNGAGSKQTTIRALEFAVLAIQLEWKVSGWQSKDWMRDKPETIRKENVFS